MKTLFLLIFFSISAAAQNSEIVNFRLDSKVVHTIYCHERNNGVTTVVFPSEISGIYAARVDVKFNEKNPNPFLLSFTPGSSYFTIKSLSANNAIGAVNVIHEKKVYVIHLKTVKKGQSAVSFIPPKKPIIDLANNKGYKRANVPSAALLLSMLDKAKAYHLIKKHYPSHVESLSYDSPETLSNYSAYQILLKEVIRYEAKDTIFFHIQIKNKSLKELRYNPKDFAVNVSDKIFYSMLSDASGIVPPESQTTAWFCISGTKAGGRNNLAVKNDWKILLNLSQISDLPKQAQPDSKEIHKKELLPLLKDIELEEKK